MRFVLHYRGPLRSNGSTSHKQEVRRAFHVQLKRLWSQPPLSEVEKLLHPPREGHFSNIRSLGGFTFAPLVTAQLNGIVELTVTVLRPEPPGHLITQGGDIDNRMKTLFDALTMPRLLNALPNGAAPLPDETPFFCLLEDDNLVTALSVRTEQLLEPVADQTHVDVSVTVETGVTRQSMINFILS